MLSLAQTQLLPVYLLCCCRLCLKAVAATCSTPERWEKTGEDVLASVGVALASGVTLDLRICSKIARTHIVMCFCCYKRRTFSCGFVQIHILTDKNPPWGAVWWQSAARKERFELPSCELKGWFCKMLKGIPCHSVSLWKIHLSHCDKQPMNGGRDLIKMAVLCSPDNLILNFYTAHLQICLSQE